MIACRRASDAVPPGYTGPSMAIFQSDARVVLKRLADKAFQTSQERDQLLAQLATAEALKAKDLAWMLFRPDRAYRDAVLPLLVPKLAPSAWLYIESPLSVIPALGRDWQLHRQGSTREVRYALYRRVPELAAAPTVTLPPDPAGTAPAAKA